MSKQNNTETESTGCSGLVPEVAPDTEQLSETWTPGPWVLEVCSAHQSFRIKLTEGKSVILGSGRQLSSPIRDSTVSTRHCRVSATPHGLLLEDLRSTNGTFVGGARVQSALISGTGGTFVIGCTSVTARPQPDTPPRVVTQPIPGFVAQTSLMRQLVSDIRSYARLQRPVLIQGESGTGKDLVARALHELSGRAGQYLPLNVAAFPEALVDSELFGHKKGAFTGATNNRVGAFELAHKGTLFLDEIADLLPQTQVKLLRVVEDGQVRPIGCPCPTQVSVRVISASWADLAERVHQGQFRADLYHRLSTVVLKVPTLKQRIGDIPALSAALLQRMQDEVGCKRLTGGAMARLVEYSWPGNVRQLSSVLYRAAIRTAGPLIGSRAIQLPTAPDLSGYRKRPVDALNLLDQHAGNVSAAARAAGVPRSTFRAWLDRAKTEPVAH